MSTENGEGSRCRAEEGSSTTEPKKENECERCGETTDGSIWVFFPGSAQ
jgi:hypothetical protein